jgi:hypothetical protein
MDEGFLIGGRGGRTVGRSDGRTVVYTSDERSDGSFIRPLKSAKLQRISGDEP